ncbi:MAG: CHAT domain-containing protein [Polyangiaceae bacterium]|nr:CHAT domain-containing protein [Polyangiaceae bacterium]
MSARSDRTTRTVTLELLRHGPSNNQLLSPLTPYLALCGNHDAETVNVGFEHLQMMRRLRQLRYVDGQRAARSALLEASSEVSRLVASIRSLTAEMSSAPRGDRRLVHLRLVLSASELALLPFELITSPPGFPGRGQPLSLQTVTPITLTREVRRVSASTMHWPDTPKILVVAASPRGLSPVPLRAHLLAIRRALAPFLVTGEVKELEQHVTVLPDASLSDVREASAADQFTHVHVLAHGYESSDTDDGELRYGLAFHADEDRDRIDVVSGSRLAAALRCHPRSAVGTELSSPTMVTVASCDSGNVGSVVAQGASVAHELHEAGIPLVLASQFPISTRGSAIMAELVYRRILRGDDPRLLVHDLRQELHVASPETHDWASIVAYAALPPDIDAQVKKARFHRARCAVDTVMRRLDANQHEQEPRREDVLSLEKAMDAFEAAVPEDDTPAERVHAYGLLASAKKSAARLFYGEPPWPLLVLGEPARALPAAGGAGGLAMALDGVAALMASSAGSPSGHPRHGAAAQLRSRAALDEARGYYMKAFRLSSSEPWAAVQALALRAALDPMMEDDEHRLDFADRWTTARVIARDNLVSATPQIVVWAHGALIELYVLAQLLPAEHPARENAWAMGIRHVDQLLAILSTDPYEDAHFDAYSVLRQLRRYTDWWWRDRHELRRLPDELGQRLRRAGVKSRWA